MQSSIFNVPSKRLSLAIYHGTAEHEATKFCSGAEVITLFVSRCLGTERKACLSCILNIWNGRREQGERTKEGEVNETARVDNAANKQP